MKYEVACEKATPLKAAERKTNNGAQDGLR
jgi:hypothetical protein